MIPSMMRAVVVPRVGGPEVLEYCETVTPSPKADQVLVRSEVIGVGKYDALLRTGTYPFMPTLPAIPGVKMSGIVEWVGPDVREVELGQRVQVWKFDRGCYAEYVACSPHELTILPDDVSFINAICIPNFQVAWSILSDAVDLKRLQTVYVNGAAGGVGTAVLQICRALGIDAIATVSSAAKAAFALKQGARHAIVSTKENPVARTLGLTNGRGVDLMIDQFVGPNFGANLKMIAKLGSIVTINTLGGTPTTNLFDDLRLNLAHSVAVRAFSVHVYGDQPEERRRIANDVLRFFQTKAVMPAVMAEYPLASAADAHRMLDAGSILGEVVLRP